MLKKTQFKYFFIFLFFLMFVMSSNTRTHANSKYASIIIEEHSEKILYSRSANQLRYPASMTKVMTLYLIFEEIQNGNLNHNSRILFSKRAAGQPPSKLGIKQGHSISLEEAILALVTKSANDVATAVAEKISGSEINFAKRMTQKAKNLGMNKTRFMNASGLYNKYQKSTAFDMAKLGIAIKRDFPLRYKIFNTTSFNWNGRKYKNHNNLLKSYSGTDGIKTGYIGASGFNLMASVERNGIRLIGVVFGGKSSKRRDLHLMGLFTNAFKSASPPNLILVSTPLSKPNFISIRAPSSKPKTFISVIKDFETPIPKPIHLAISNLSKKIINIKNWGIQVGTYSKKVSAHQIAIKARRIAPELLKMLPAQLTPIYINENMAWRVRFNSLDENSARTTCSKLLSKNISCVPVPSEQLLGYLIKKQN
jgi:D-alanyl-D-alanine carboxypeptidase